MDCQYLKKIPESQYWCELSDNPCIMYQGDSPTDNYCNYSEEEDTSNNIHPSYHHARNQPKCRGSNLL